MTALLMVVHVIVCIALIIAVLLQTGKGAAMGATFGGGSQTLFGSRGAGNFMTKATAVIGAIFMITSLSLSIVSMNVVGGSVVEELPAKEGAAAPMNETAPANPATQTFGSQPPPAAGSPAEPSAAPAASK